MWIIPSYPKLGAVLHISFTFADITYSISKLMQFYYLKISRIYPIISITTDTQYIGMFHMVSHNYFLSSQSALTFQSILSTYPRMTFKYTNPVILLS